MKKTRLIIIICLILQSCTFTGSYQKQAEANLILSFKNQLHSNTPLELLKQKPALNLYPAVYLFAKDLLQQNEIQRACLYLEWLQARSLQSPLNHLTNYRHRINCQSSFLTLTEVENFPLWLKESILRDALELHHNHSQFDLTLALVQFEHTQAQKLKLINKVLTDEKNHPEALAMREIVAPRFIKSPKLEHFFSIARDYEYIRDFNQARLYYEKIIQSRSSDLELKIQSYERLAQTYKVQRNRDIYWQELEALSLRLLALAQETHQPIVQQAYIDNRVTKARALWTAHQRSAGQEILLSIRTQSYASENQKAQIDFILGAMEHEQGNFDHAVAYFKSGLKFDISDARVLENLLWSYGWNLFQNKQYSSASDVFNEAFDRLPEIHFQSKVLFWRAMSLDRLQNKRLSKKYLRELKELNPLSYYGLLAHHHLNEPLKPLNQQNKLMTLDDDLDWIYFFGETLAAQNYIKEFSDFLEQQPEEILRKLTQAELYDQAIFRYNRAQNKLSQKQILPLIPYGFPRPFIEHFSHFTNLYEFPLEIALALTRQESAFNQYARSWADAFGLMQLIPERAKEVAKKAHVVFNTNDDLYDPELNIQLGVFHLGELKKRFNHQFPFYVAAYNAGEAPVHGWQKNRFNGHILEFIENIPYRETQNYVKLIFRNAAFYRMLISDRPFMISELGLIE